MKEHYHANTRQDNPIVVEIFYIVILKSNIYKQ